MNEDKGARYHRLHRQAVLASAVFAVAWLGGLYATGASRLLAAAAARVTSALPPTAGRAAAIVLFVAVLVVGYEIISLPLAAYRGWFLERRYGLSTQRLGSWVGDHLKGLGLMLVLSAGAAIVLYASVHASTRWWWALTAAAFAGATLLLTIAAPVALMPLFYRFKPLEREALRERLLTLSKRAGVPVLGVFEWGLGEKSARANAALVGLGGTRRILLSDTLLRDYSDDEIEVVLAHEMAHHVHYDMWSGLAVEAGSLLIALFVASRVVPDARELAALPVIALAAGAVSVLLTPVTNAWSRHHERRADRFALALTERPAAFVSAMRRLGAQNLADEHPSRLTYWFFHSHPTIEERIAASRG